MVGCWVGHSVVTCAYFHHTEDQRTEVEELDRAYESYMHQTIILFCYLQLLDFLTTIVGLRLGAGELSPFIRLLMTVGPVTGVALSKVVALLLAGVCLALHKVRPLQLVNYWFAGLVLWNLANIFVAVSH